MMKCCCLVFREQGHAIKHKKQMIASGSFGGCIRVVVIFFKMLNDFLHKWNHLDLELTRRLKVEHHTKEFVQFSSGNLHLTLAVLKNLFEIGSEPVDEAVDGGGVNMTNF